MEKRTVEKNRLEVRLCFLLGMGSNPDWISAMIAGRKLIFYISDNIFELKAGEEKKQEGCDTKA